MIWTAWNNGKYSSTGAGYGFKIDASDLNDNFSREHSTVIIELVDPSSAETIKVIANIAKESFWGDCRELISQLIGRWLLDNGFAPWPTRLPPKFNVHRIEPDRYRVVGRL